MSSADENSEPTLKEMVTQTLENNGILGKIQAELRASIFLTLEDELKERNIPLINKKSQELLSSPVGKLSALIVEDFLHCLGLDFSLSVFGPESNFSSGDSADVISRQSLLNQLKAGTKTQKDKNRPFLFHLIEDAHLMKPSLTDNKEAALSERTNFIEENRTHLDDAKQKELMLTHSDDDKENEKDAATDSEHTRSDSPSDNHSENSHSQSSSGSSTIHSDNASSSSHNSMPRSNRLSGHDSDDKASRSRSIHSHSTSSTISEKSNRDHLDVHMEGDQTLLTKNNPNNTFTLPSIGERVTPETKQEIVNKPKSNDDAKEQGLHVIGGEQKDQAKIVNDPKGSEVKESSGESSEVMEEFDEDISDLMSSTSLISNQTQDISESQISNPPDFQESL